MLKHVTPKEGLLVRDPFTDPPSHLPAKGKVVEYNTHWERRRLAGDVTVTDPKPIKTKNPGKEEAKGGGAADNSNAAAQGAAPAK